MSNGMGVVWPICVSTSAGQRSQRRRALAEEAAEGDGFDVLLISDKNMRYQQNLRGRRIAIVVRGNSNRPIVHREIDRVEIDQLEGRATAVLLTPYPPGIPLLIPGERFNKTIVEYLKFARMFNERFPGFDTDIHGLVEETVAGKKRYYVDCVRPNSLLRMET